MNSTKELHYRYILSYLLIAIILIVALAYYNVPNLVDKFSFALTLSSLLLAVLAIFYTIISAQKQDLQLSKLVETNANLDSSAHQIVSAAADIRLFAREAPQHFQTIGHKIDSLTASYGTLKSSQSPEAKDREGDGPSSDTIDRKQFVQMFAKLQFAAMGVLYLFERSSAKEMTIEPETIEALGINSFEYAIGVLNGLEVAGLITFKIHKSSVIPTSCAPAVSEGIKEQLVHVLRVVDETNAEKIKKWMEAIDAHAA